MKSNNQNKWNQKFKERSNELMAPEEFLVDHINLMKKGTVLDFACGDGRNAIYFQNRGFYVTGVDFSEEGLKRLQYFAQEYGLNVTTELRDLSNLEEVKGLGRYNNIIVNHYKPTDEVLLELTNHLEDGGVLLVNTFNQRQADVKGFPREYCLEGDELLWKFENLKLVKYKVYTDERGYLDGYIFQKKAEGK